MSDSSVFVSGTKSLRYDFGGVSDSSVSVSGTKLLRYGLGGVSDSSVSVSGTKLLQYGLKLVHLRFLLGFVEVFWFG